MKQEHKILYITASAQREDSVTRRFAGELIEQLRSQHQQVQVHTRDVAQGLPFINQDWVRANFTPAGQRTNEQHSILEESDRLVQEIMQADSLVIATPMYNFNVPASLKAWIDQIVRVGLTFKYTSEGSVGLLTGKKAYLVMASGGTPFGSEIDGASGYLRNILGFIGITDVASITAEGLKPDDMKAVSTLQSRITQLARKAA